MKDCNPSDDAVPAVPHQSVCLDWVKFETAHSEAGENMTAFQNWQLGY